MFVDEWCCFAHSMLTELSIEHTSGAGKSTLLNILARRNTNNTGDVLLNNKPFTNSMKATTGVLSLPSLA